MNAAHATAKSSPARQHWRLFPLMGHDHGHVTARAGARHAKRLWWSFALILGFLGVQVVTGIITGSLALLSDAGHMATDSTQMGMALAAISAANRATQAAHRTFGLYRLEILAALANAGLLFGVAIYVLIEAIGRLDNPPEIASAPVFVVGVIGLLVNLVAFRLAPRRCRREPEREGRLLRGRGRHTRLHRRDRRCCGDVGDRLGLGRPGHRRGDRRVILPRAWKLGRSALRILVQAAPEGLDVGNVTTSLSAIEGVADVHDVHVWTLTSGMDVLTAHIAITASTSTQHVLDTARAMLADQFHLTHATLSS